MNHSRTFILGVLLGFVLGCDRQPEPRIAGTPAAENTAERVVVDRLDREVRFKATPQRIISLMPAATELMYAIGASSQLVGVTKNCNYPPEAETLERVGGGTMESISREKIISLKPDLVLCKWDHHQPLMETLAQFNITALAIGPETFEELFAEAKMLGGVTGHVAEADQLITRMRQRLAGISERIGKIPTSQRRKVFYEVWDDPLMTAGPGSFIGESLRLAGMQNIFEDATAAYPKVSDEVVVSRNPDVIFSPSTHASRVSLEEMLQRQGWGEVTAIKEKQVFIVDGDAISRCGPRLLDAIEEMISLAYPNAGVQPLSDQPGEVGVQLLENVQLKNVRDSYSYSMKWYSYSMKWYSYSIRNLRVRVPATPENEYKYERRGSTELLSWTLSLGDSYAHSDRLKPRHQRITETKP